MSFFFPPVIRLHSSSICRNFDLRIRFRIPYYSSNLLYFFESFRRPFEILFPLFFVSPRFVFDFDFEIQYSSLLYLYSPESFIFPPLIVFSDVFFDWYFPLDFGISIFCFSPRIPCILILLHSPFPSISPRVMLGRVFLISISEGGERSESPRFVGAWYFGQGSAGWNVALLGLGVGGFSEVWVGGTWELESVWWGV